MSEVKESEGQVVLGNLSDYEPKKANNKSCIAHDKFWQKVSAYGFEVGYKNVPQKGNKEYILYNKQKGLILYLFFRGNKLITARAYGEVCHEEMTQNQKRILTKNICTGPHFELDDGWHWKFVLNMKEVEFSIIDEIYENFTVCNPWSQVPLRPTLRFLTPSEEIVNIDIYDIINKKIKASDPEVRKIIGR